MRRAWIFGLLLILICACRKRPTRSPVEQAQLRPAAEWLAQEPVRLLRDYVRIETTEERGEKAGAEFLKGFFDCAGIQNDLVCPRPGRCNILARIPGRQREGALLLLNHIDVVPAYAKYWKESQPWEGEIKGGFLYGRGVYDMKSLAIVQALALREVKRLGVLPRSDILFLAEADEEFGQKWGARWLLAHRPEWFRGVRYVLNEGGVNEMILRDVRFFGVETLQSGTAWAELEGPEEALTSLAGRWKSTGEPIAPASIHPHVRQGFDILANHLVHPLTELLRDLDGTLADPKKRAQLPDRYGAFLEPRTFWSPVYGHPIGADPPQSRRIVVVLSTPPSVDPGPIFTAILKDARSHGIVAARAFASEPTQASPFAEGERLDPLVEVMRLATEAHYSGISFGPVPTQGVYTTSVLFRRLGYRSYGFSPFPMNLFDASRRHLNDERIFLLDYVRGVPLYQDLVLEYAMSGHEVSTSAGQP